MTEPHSQQGDASSAILIAVTELRGEVRAALAVQATHATTISRHDTLLVEHGNRTTALETLVRPMPGQLDAIEQRRYVSPTALYAVCTLAVAAIAALVTFLAIYHGAA